ncbi:MAG: ABC transporter permease [Saccharofermentanales bacterium]
MTHRRVSVRSVFIVGRGSIRRRFARIISVSVVIALALCALAVVKDINDLGDRVSDEVNVSYLDSDLITLYYPRTANQGYLEKPFDDDEVVSGLRVKYGFREIVPVYMMNEPWLLSRGSRACECVVKQVNVNEFFDRRIMSFDIEGRFPESDDEILISSAVLPFAFDTFDVSAVKKRIEAEDGLKCSMQLENLKMNVLRQTSFFKWSLLLVGVILAVISIAMLGSFSKLSVLERKKEIAIIKSLGASDMEVLLTLWFDSVCISVISAVMAAGVTFAFTEVVPSVIPELAFAEFGFPGRALLMFSGMFFAMVLIFTFFGMRRLVRTMPAELMRG